MGRMKFLLQRQMYLRLQKSARSNYNSDRERQQNNKHGKVVSDKSKHWQENGKDKQRKCFICDSASHLQRRCPHNLNNDRNNKKFDRKRNSRGNMSRWWDDGDKSESQSSVESDYFYRISPNKTSLATKEKMEILSRLSMERNQKHCGR